MSDRVWLLRHGDTEWTEQEKHTGLRDVPLSEAGRDQARRAGKALTGQHFAHVLVSPQIRAQETCRLAGFDTQARTWDELVEWDYGDYEGLTDEQTRERDSNWDLFRDGAPGGESATQVSQRADRVIDAIERLDGDCLVVGHGKLLRVLAARWIGQEVALGAALPLDPAALGMLERETAGRLLRLWNYSDAALPNSGS